MDLVTYSLCKKYVDVTVRQQITTTYKMGGSVPFADLPQLDNTTLNHIYIITDDFTTTDDFLQGAGKKYTKGTNVAVIDDKGVLKYDIFNEGSKSEGGMEAITVETRFDLPTVGSAGGVYFVKQEGATYRWDNETGKYECAGRDYQNVTIINGSDYDLD